MTVPRRIMISRRMARQLNHPEWAGSFRDMPLTLNMNGRKRDIANATQLPGISTAWQIPPVLIVEDPATPDDIDNLRAEWAVEPRPLGDSIENDGPPLDALYPSPMECAEEHPAGVRVRRCRYCQLWYPTYGMDERAIRGHLIYSAHCGRLAYTPNRGCPGVAYAKQLQDTP